MCALLYGAGSTRARYPGYALAAGHADREKQSRHSAEQKCLFRPACSSVNEISGETCVPQIGSRYSGIAAAADAGDAGFSRLISSESLRRNSLTAPLTSAAQNRNRMTRPSVFTVPESSGDSRDPLLRLACAWRLTLWLRPVPL